MTDSKIIRDFEDSEIRAAAKEHLLWEVAVGSVGIRKMQTQTKTRKVEQSAATLDAIAPADDQRVDVLRTLAEKAAACSACDLHKTRTKSVFARGNPFSKLVFVGEGPGAHEDQQGEPFVGQAGKLLDKMITAMGLSRDAVYICNAVKCRPPDNRTPLPEESAACSGFLSAQIAAVAPRVIVTLGRCATEALGLSEPGAKNWRGLWSEWNGVPVMATYHPAFLLRSPQYKRPVWEDLQKVMQKLEQTT